MGWLGSTRGGWLYGILDWCRAGKRLFATAEESARGHVGICLTGEGSSGRMGHPLPNSSYE